MDRLSEMQAFVQVVESGGFTDAANRLGVSKSSVSKQVAALEARLAARLLTRTTRRVTPTELGLAYYDRARRVLLDVDEADSMVASLQSTPRGLLRISAPVTFGNRQLAQPVARFLARYPEIDIELSLDDRFVELVAEGFDLAIRIGTLPDSALRARKLAEVRTLLVAAPAYLAEHGTPASIDDLSGHGLLQYTNLASGSVWRLRTPAGEERQVRVAGRLVANNGESLMRAAEEGVGIALVPDFMLGDAIAAGRLLEVLPDRPHEILGVHAVYPPGRFPQPKLRAIVDFLAEAYRPFGPGRWP